MVLQELHCSLPLSLERKLSRENRILYLLKGLTFGTDAYTLCEQFAR